MFRLWFMMEFEKDSKGVRNKLTSYFKLIEVYLLPTLLLSIWAMYSQTLFSAKEQLEVVAIDNLVILCITHFMIQKFFFTKLEKDVIIKFLPDKTYDYIKVRLFMILLKWNLPFILPSVLYLRKVFLGSSFIFYLTSSLFIISWFIMNYLIAIYSRYIKNVVSGAYKIIINTVIYIIYLLLIIVLPSFVTIKLLEYLAVYYNNSYVISYFYINSFTIGSVVVSLVLLIALLSFSNKYFKFNIRKLVINRRIIENFKTRKETDKYIKILIRVIPNKLTDLEEKILIKDIKNFYRESMVFLSFMIIMQLIISILLIYIYFSDIPHNFQEAMRTFPLIDLIVIIFMFIFFFTGGIGSFSYFNINNDMNLLNKYGIKVTRENLFNSKRKFATIMFFLPILFFYIIVFITIINIWSWLTIILSFISAVLVEKLLSLTLIKITNRDSSDNIIITISNFLILGLCIKMFISIYKNPPNLKTIELFFVFNLGIIVCYLFNLKINVNRIKVNKGNK